MSKKIKKCPKCGSLRPEDTATPEWQCPNCLVAYSKVEKYESKIKILNQQRENAGVLGLLDYIFIIILSVVLFFFLSPVLYAITEVVLIYLKAAMLNGLIFIASAFMISFLFIIYSLLLAIIPLIIGITTRSFIAHNNSYNKSMTIVECIIVCVCISGGNLLVNNMNSFNAVIQAVLISFVMYFVAERKKKKQYTSRKRLK